MLCMLGVRILLGLPGLRRACGLLVAEARTCFTLSYPCRQGGESHYMLLQ